MKKRVAADSVASPEESSPPALNQSTSPQLKRRKLDSTIYVAPQSNTVQAVPGSLDGWVLEGSRRGCSRVLLFGRRGGLNHDSEVELTSVATGQYQFPQEFDWEAERSISLSPATSPMASDTPPWASTHLPSFLDNGSPSKPEIQFEEILTRSVYLSMVPGVTESQRENADVDLLGLLVPDAGLMCVPNMRLSTLRRVADIFSLQWGLHSYTHQR